MILNSVIQYFPSVEYLLDVLRAAMRVVRPNGHIYLGDVRSLPLLDAFHTSVQLSKAGGRVSAHELRRRVAQAIRNERELVLAPDLFEDLVRRWPQPERVEFFRKTGAYDNELSRFRYDVLMTLGAKASISAAAAAAAPVPVPDAEYRRFGTSPSWASFGRAQAAVLRDHLRAALPAAMVPERIVILQAWPMTVNGKIDRDALPAPEVDERAGTNQAPRSAEEEILHGLYAELLDRREIGIGEDFFALGGHSLMAARLVGRIRSALNVDVPIRTVFESPSIAALAARLWETRDGRVPLTAMERPARVPLSSVQRRLWSIDRRDGGSPQYNLLRAVRIDGDLDTAALERAVDEIVARHEVLRTSFHVHHGDHDGDAFQMVAPELRITIPLLDLSSLDERERQARVRRFLVADAGHCFDLTRAPMMRMTLLKVATHSHVLVRTMHYIVKDGWSEGLFNRELSRLYRQHHRGEATPLEPLRSNTPTSRCGSSARWKQAHGRAVSRIGSVSCVMCRRAGHAEAPHERRGAAAAARSRRDRDDDRRRRDGRPAPSESRDRHDALHDAARGAGCRADAMRPRTRRRRHRLARGQPSGSAARTCDRLFRESTADAVARHAGDDTSRAAACRVRQTTLEAYQHQDVPYEQLIEELWPERRTERDAGIPDAAGLSERAMGSRCSLDGLRVEPVKWPQLHARIDLEVNAWLIGASAR